ncbi:hypothetical protein BURCENBC7_AP6318 [Burkholderia cenocepacia BC7]|nr:hypothetical protein BURCENBC7_AP6318 [Burkholderia cenocepacia BC7]
MMHDCRHRAIDMPIRREMRGLPRNTARCLAVRTPIGSGDATPIEAYYFRLRRGASP